MEYKIPQSQSEAATALREALEKLEEIFYLQVYLEVGEMMKDLERTQEIIADIEDVIWEIDLAIRDYERWNKTDEK